MIPVRTYTFDVEGLGQFRARKRTMRDQIRLEAEVNRITGGPCSDEGLLGTARALAELVILIEAGPDGWDAEALDPLDEADCERLFRVHKELRDAETRFRAGS